jgi:F-box and WD-40 domain protein 1/11
MSVISNLPTSSVVSIVESLRPRLYINFFRSVPPEICLRILGFLDPVSLVNTAKASREWMALSLDWKLWEQLYHREGWRTIRSEIVRFEEELAQRSLQPGRPRTGTGPEDDEPRSKKRVTPTLLSQIHAEDKQKGKLPVDPNDDLEMTDVGSSIFGGPLLSRTASPDRETAMGVANPDSSAFTSAQSSFQSSGSSSTAKSFQTTADTTMDFSRSQSAALLLSTLRKPLSISSSLVVKDYRTGKQKLNWHHLYNQRRRLEANWESEKYVNFQLPQPDHMEEAHGQCIYTIQHIGNILVSGSRDRTIHKWDLETRRRIGRPLTGHRGSVLCLQFDPSPEEDVIISGSSDSDVIIWKFSTGQLVQRLKGAHDEPVLNLKFDRRILVTCSKDKTIKVFNRKPVQINDPLYPIWHDHNFVAPVPRVFHNAGFNLDPTADLQMRAPYSAMGTLDGHGAAINAVQIQGDEIVSASGDRTIKVWDWPTKTCTRTLIGHQKGIACVQYDGRRVVSGSSDNEVKVFDKDTGLEVASLKAHSNLVRTVQAGFGDLPYSLEEDSAEAKLIDRAFFEAVDDGTLPDHPRNRKGRRRNAGSRLPEDITAYGANLPPGGGGGRYGRIVSGSYDETIIIWRRDKQGVWRAQHTLRQEDAARAAAARHFPRPQMPHSDAFAELIRRREARALNSLAAVAGPSNQSVTSQTSQAGSSTAATAGDTSATSTPTGSVDGHLSDVRHLATEAFRRGPLALREVLSTHPSLLHTSMDFLMHSISLTPHAHRIHFVTEIQQALMRNPSSAAGPAHNGPAPVGAAQLPMGGNARVFKLQFDARRIICCSQNPIIVGWDFANGDEAIIEASRFFGTVE